MTKMRKKILEGFTALFVISLFGMALVSCGPFFDIDGDVRGNGDDNNGGGQPPIPPPAAGYVNVMAYDWMDLADYLQSDETSYAITLETEKSDIYLQRNLSIVKPMTIIGPPGKAITIHSVNREGGNTFYCLDLQADLELQYCGFIGYAGTSTSANRIAAGTPPLNIRADRTLTMSGKDSVLELRGIGGGNAIRSGSQVKLRDNASYVDAGSGDLLFKAGVEKLTVNGKVSMENNLTVVSGAMLHIENGGELRVVRGGVLTLDKEIKEMRLDGNIVVDRTGSPGGSLIADGLAEGSLLEKITGENGSLSIENDETGTTVPFEHGVNTIIELSSSGINLGKMVGLDIGGEIRLIEALKIPKGKKLFVGAGMDLIVNNNEITLEGGTLDVRGRLNVTGNGKITIRAEDKFIAMPKGSVTIGSSGSIIIDDGGTFKDESVSWDEKSFTLPSYGPGTLIVNQKTTGTGGIAVIGKETVRTIIGPDNSALLKFDTPTASLSIKTVSNKPEFTLKGNGTLNVTGGQTLEGRFIVAGGALLIVSVTQDSENNPFIVRTPNQLIGAGTNQPVPRMTITGNGGIGIYSNATDTGTTHNNGTYEWKGTSSPSWQ